MRNRNWKKARWERQRREAIKQEQVVTCYKQYQPPQTKERNRVVSVSNA